MCSHRIPKTSFAQRTRHETSGSFACLFSEFDLILLHPFSIAITIFQTIPILLCIQKACAKHLQVLVCTTPNTTLYSKSLHKAPPSTSLYYRASKKHAPVFLCTTKLGTKHIPVPLCSTNLAQSMFQYYFVLQSLKKRNPSSAFKYKCPSTILYFKACTSLNHKAFVQILIFKSHPWCTKMKLSCDASFKFQKCQLDTMIFWVMFS